MLPALLLRWMYAADTAGVGAARDREGKSVGLAIGVDPEAGSGRLGIAAAAESMYTGAVAAGRGRALKSFKVRPVAEAAAARRRPWGSAGKESGRGADT